MPLVKHRRASPRIIVDFGPPLAELNRDGGSVTLSTVDAVVITRKDIVNGVRTWVDVTTEFHDATSTAADFPEPAFVSGRYVKFRPGEVADDDANAQAVGTYELRVDVTLSDNQHWVHRGALQVIDDGDEFIQ